MMQVRGAVMVRENTYLSMNCPARHAAVGRVPLDGVFRTWRTESRACANNGPIFRPRDRSAD